MLMTTTPPPDQPAFPESAPRSIRWGPLVGIWSVLMVMIMLQGYLGSLSGSEPWSWRNAAMGPVTWMPWALVTPLIFKLVRRAPLRRTGFIRALALHLAAGLAIAIAFMLWMITAEVLLASGSASKPAATFSALLTRGLIMGTVPSLMLYGVVAAVGHGVELRRRYRATALEAARLNQRSATLERQLTDSRLQALRMQLQPHFLFNTLNAISALVEHDPMQARTMIARLSDLLRATLDGGEYLEVTLDEEIETLERYLDIERVRFGDRLRVTYDVDGDARQLLVPALLLQPLAENAIRHGIAPRSRPGHIQIIAKREYGTKDGNGTEGAEAHLRLGVADNGVGPHMPVTEGIGLSTTRERLAQLYNGDAHLSLLPQEGGGAMVELILPVRATTASEGRT